MSDLEQEFPNVSALMGCYFHQDWDLDDPDEDAVLARFACNASQEKISLVVSEIQLLMALQLDEPQLAQLVDKMGCNYFPPGAGLTYAAWLSHATDCLAALLDKKLRS